MPLIKMGRYIYLPRDISLSCIKLTDPIVMEQRLLSWKITYGFRDIIKHFQYLLLRFLQVRLYVYLTYFLNPVT